MILYLGNLNSSIVPWLTRKEKQVTCYSGASWEHAGNLDRFEWLVVFGYRHRIKKEHLDLFNGRTVNIHISMLPWNRGADPNFWSFFDNTPKGVTLHRIDEGIDTGPIYRQIPVQMSFFGETFKSSYDKLIMEAEALFKSNWFYIKKGLTPSDQVGNGTTHKKRELDPHREYIMNNLNEPTDEVIGVVEDTALSATWCM